MPEDRSLDDFAEADDGEPAENDSDDSEDEATGSADATDVADPADADPATATSTWHADGAACDRCGDRARRRWRDDDDDAFVCADCVSW
jgi:hypothetical protein